MKKNNRCLAQWILVGLISALFWACGSSTDHKTTDDNPNITPHTPSTPLTGDVSLFPNAHLLADINAPDAEKTVIIDTRSAEAYASGHVKGAINLDWKAFVLWNAPPEKAVLKPVADLEKQFSDLGLTRTSKMVIYDDTLTSWGSAGRIFWMLEYFGCINVQVLNGGWDKWKADNLWIPTPSKTDRTRNMVTVTSTLKKAMSSRLPSCRNFSGERSRSGDHPIGFAVEPGVN